MQTIYADYKKVNSDAGTVVAIGNFDGVHKGHRCLLDTLKNVAKERGLPSVVYTFLKHPKNVILGDDAQKLLYPNEIKEKLIADTGVHTLFFEDFSQVRELSCEEFAEKILKEKFNASAVVIGENGRFGKNSCGTAEKLKSLGELLGFDVFVVESVTAEGVVCSSSEIRKKIEAGDFKKAAALLGRNYTVSGTVIEDKHLGRTYGYPTANLVPESNRARILRGVYATNTIVGDKKYKSITNVGTTSFDDFEKERIETHILDFSENLYRQTIEVEFLYYMRDFKSFISTDELKMQLDEDKKERKLGGN